MSEKQSIIEAEEWRDIAGYEGFFQVSNLGRVKSLARVIMKKNQFGPCANPVKEKILTATPSAGSNGKYATVCLSVHGRSKTHLVHQLVLEAFVGSCPEGMECRHFPDSNPMNNRLDNIQWGTKIQNQADRKFHGTSGGWKHTAEFCAMQSEKMKAIWRERKRKAREAF